MAVTGEDPRLRLDPEPPAATRRRLRTRDSVASDALHRVCPYLVAGDGGWRSVTPTRDHRCGATQPPALLALPKQRDLCLAASHEGCATYAAALDLEEGDAAATDPQPAGLWPGARATVLALEPARGRVAPRRSTAARTGGQALLVGLMVLAFVVLVVARTTPTQDGPGPGASAAAAGASASAVPGVAAGPTEVAPSAMATARPSSASPPASSVTPAPSAPTTPSPGTTAIAGVRYRVKAGDTLYSIAVAHGTTVRKIKKANGLTGNVLHAGQELVIPS